MKVRIKVRFRHNFTEVKVRFRHSCKGPICTGFVLANITASPYRILLKLTVLTSLASRNVQGWNGWLMLLICPCQLIFKLCSVCRGEENPYLFCASLILSSCLWSWRFYVLHWSRQVKLCVWLGVVPGWIQWMHILFLIINVINLEYLTRVSSSILPPPGGAIAVGSQQTLHNMLTMILFYVSSRFSLSVCSTFPWWWIRCSSKDNFPKKVNVCAVTVFAFHILTT